MNTVNENDRLLLFRLQLLAKNKNWQAIEAIAEKYLEDNAKDLSRPGVAPTQVHQKDKGC